MRQRRLPLAGRATGFHRLARSVAARQQFAAPLRPAATPRFAPAVAIIPDALPAADEIVPIIQAAELAAIQPLMDDVPLDDLPVSDVAPAIAWEQGPGEVAASVVSPQPAPAHETPPRPAVPQASVVPAGVPPTPPAPPTLRDAFAARPTSVREAAARPVVARHDDGEPQVNASAAPLPRQDALPVAPIAPVTPPVTAVGPPRDAVVDPVREAAEPPRETVTLPLAPESVPASALAAHSASPVTTGEHVGEPVAAVVEVVAPRRPRPSAPAFRAPRLSPQEINARLAAGVAPVVSTERPADQQPLPVEEVAPDERSGARRVQEDRSVGFGAGPELEAATPIQAESVPTNTASTARRVAGPTSAPPVSAPRAGGEQRAEQSGPPVEGMAPGASPRARPAASVARPPQPTTADELFAPRDTDRSPAAWFARLTGQARPAEVADEMAAPIPVVATPTPAAPAMPGPDAPRAVPPIARGEWPPAVTRTTPATALPQSTRQFLRPLVGFDPGSIPVYSGPRAAELAAHLGADALAVGEAAVLGAGHQPDATDLATLGVLAHELTHIARRREPRFVPPIARIPGAPPPTDEEALARRVEARTARATRDEIISPVATLPSPLASSARGATDALEQAVDAGTPAMAGFAPTLSPTIPMSVEPAPANVATPMPIDAPPVELAQGDWNGLPAPWEPLPDWLRVEPATPGPVFGAAAPAPTMDASGAGFATAPSPPVALAETGRPLDTDGGEPADRAPVPAGAAPPEPDLDALARQVYNIVRRRLAADDRRAR